MVINIEKTLRKKQAESQTELEILRIKYTNLQSNYKSVDMSAFQGLHALQNRQRMSGADSQNRGQQVGVNRQSTGKDSEVNIGLNKQSLDQLNYNNYMGKMSPLAFHKYQNTASRHDPTPSTKFGAATGDGTNRTT